jgi:hypothetical protein
MHPLTLRLITMNCLYQDLTLILDRRMYVDRSSTVIHQST